MKGNEDVLWAIWDWGIHLCLTKLTYQKREYCTILKRSTIRNSLALFCTFIWKNRARFPPSPNQCNYHSSLSLLFWFCFVDACLKKLAVRSFFSCNVGFFIWSIWNFEFKLGFHETIPRLGRFERSNFKDLVSVSRAHINIIMNPYIKYTTRFSIVLHKGLLSELFFSQ